MGKKMVSVMGKTLEEAIEKLNSLIEGKFEIVYFQVVMMTGPGNSTVIIATLNSI